jgi:hypothetical protein
VPWAARRVAGLLEPIPERLAVVRQVLELAGRHGLQTTAVILNERGIASPRGGMWSPPWSPTWWTTAATGCSALGGPWPALVDAARANRRAPAVRRDRQVHALSGLLHCCCGGRIHYSTGWRRPDGTLAHSLHCRNKDRPQIVACGRRRTRAEQYEALVEDWFLHLPDLSRAWESADEGAPERARIAEARRRYKREYFERQRLSDQEYDALMADLDGQERALPPEPAALRAKAHGIAVAQERWATWLPPARNRFLRGILAGVLINGRCALPVPHPDVGRMIRDAIP